MPGIGGLGEINTIIREFPRARIIVLTTYEGDVQASRAISAGACGYLIKSTLRNDLVLTIRQIHEGRAHICSHVTRAIKAHMADESLSAREVEVLGHVASGFSNKLIASRMGLSVETVKTHMKSILAKVNAKDRTEAVVTALRRGIIDAS
jgi:DNA-binding NarL/FixJ family response regulator